MTFRCGCFCLSVEICSKSPSLKTQTMVRSDLREGVIDVRQFLSGNAAQRIAPRRPFGVVADDLGRRTAVRRRLARTDGHPQAYREVPQRTRSGACSLRIIAPRGSLRRMKGPRPAIALLAGLRRRRRVGSPRPAIDGRTELWRQVEIVRTAHGVPHIRAENLRAGGYALAWVMSEDYGARTGLRLLLARGELSRFDGRGAARRRLREPARRAIARSRPITCSNRKRATSTTGSRRAIESLRRR